MKKTNPATWVPSLYLAESLPYAAVMLVSVVLYQEMGLSDTQIALYTSWLGLPWVIKPLWSPFIDHFRTKRWWILTMQWIIGAALAGVALSLPTTAWLQLSLVLFMLVAFGSATHDISADGFYIIALSNKDQELFVGLRNTFYRIGMVLAQGGLVMLAGKLQSGLFNIAPLPISAAWATVFMLLGVLMVVLSFYHRTMMPNVEEKDVAENFAENVSVRADNICSFQNKNQNPFLHTLKLFGKKPHLYSALLFMLFFRFPEGMLAKIVPMFLKRSHLEGGLALTDVEYGLIYGTLGVIGLLAGGILGGILANKFGQRKCFWPLVLSITLPDIIYVWLSIALPTNLWIIGSGVFVEQFGYGLGFTAYTLFLVSFSRGASSTAIFSICTALQFIGIMLPGMISGWLSDALGYTNFFWLVMGCCAITFLVSAFVKLPAED